MPINLPGGSGPKNYIEATSVTFKAKGGKYNYFDGETHDVEAIKGIIVGQWFQFLTTKIATKSKSIEYRSTEFGWDIMKNGEIPMKEFVRDKNGKAINAYGKKTYQAWKDEGMKVAKTVYVLSEDKSTMYKLIFSGRAFVEINKLIAPDAPNFIMEFWVSTDTEETDNGEFYSPTLVKKGSINPEDEELIVSKIKGIDAILNKKEVPTLSTATASDAEEMFDEDRPF